MTNERKFTVGLAATCSALSVCIVAELLSPPVCWTPPDTITARSCFYMGFNQGRMLSTLESAHVELTPRERASLDAPKYCGGK